MKNLATLITVVALAMALASALPALAAGKDKAVGHFKGEEKADTRGAEKALGKGRDKSTFGGGKKGLGPGFQVLSGDQRLPPGLAKQDPLPRGLAKRNPSLPPGLAKDHPLPPGLSGRQLPPGLRE